MKSLGIIAIMLASAAAVVEISPRVPDVSVGPDIDVSATPGVAFTEPVIAAHPGDPDRLAIVAMRGFTRAAGAPGWRCATWHTVDSGAHWTRLDIELPECADPAAAFDRVGRVHVAVLGGGGGVTVLRSDSGVRWDDRQRTGGSDHPILTRTGDALLLVVTSTRQGAGDLVSGIRVLRSEGEGTGFDLVAESITAGERANAVAPAVMADGTVVHGGMTFMAFEGGRPLFLDAGRLWALRPGGDGREVRVEIGECQTRVGFPALTGGPERAYAVCVGPGARDILVFTSEDRGRTWSVPRGIYGGAEPLLDRRARVQRRDPVLRRAVGAAVNRDGVLGVVWQDREEDPSRRCQRLLFSASRDGGITFTEPVPVSDAPSCPGGRAGEAGVQWPAGTDYGTIAAAADGSFVAAWADARGGAYQIHMARIEVG